MFIKDDLDESMIMCTDVERISLMPAIAANCESSSESDEHLFGDRDSEGHEDIRVSEVRQTDDSDEHSVVGMGHVGETDEVSEIDDDEISEADMISEKKS